MSEAEKLHEAETKEFFQDFFRLESYRRKIRELGLYERKTLVIDFEELADFNFELAQKVLENPNKHLEIAAEALKEQLKIEDPEYAEEAGEEVKVTVSNLPFKIPLRSIGAKHVSRLVYFDGIAVKVGRKQSYLVEAIFKCRCNQKIKVPQVNPSGITFPEQCPNCGRKSGWDPPIQEESKYIDHQILVLQEKFEELPAGQIPASIEVHVRGELVEKVSPGDKVTVAGIVKVDTSGSKARSRTSDYYVEALNIEVETREYEEAEVTAEDEKKIRELAKSPLIYRTIVDSIAPMIYGHEHIKEALALSLFGRNPKKSPEGLTVRGNIHVLIVGDPAMAKSQLLRFLAKISPRGFYVSGAKGSTAVGLTAAIHLDRGGEAILEAGASVIADRGVLAIDELAAMSEDERKALRELMEHQTVTVTKAGIKATLNARCSVIAAMNPKYGRWEERLTPKDNLGIEEQLLSRFDLIFRVQDTPQKELDEALADHILTFHKTHGASVKLPLDQKLLKKYIAYARSRVNTKISEEAYKKLKEYYLKLREKSKPGEVSVTPRQLEALIRLTEARARIFLREEATEEDAEAAINLMEISMRDVGVIQPEGTMDVDVLLTGKPQSLREKITLVVETVRNLHKERGEPIPIDEVMEILKEKAGTPRYEAERIIYQLLREGTLYRPKDGFLAPTKGR